MTNARYTIIGYDYTMGACDCCGREGLKRTVKLVIGERTSNYGVGCAARAVSEPNATIRRELARIEREAEDTARAEREAAAVRAAYESDVQRDAEGWLPAWVASTPGAAERFIADRRARIARFEAA